MNTRYLLLALTVAAAMACDKKKVEPTAPILADTNAPFFL